MKRLLLSIILLLGFSLPANAIVTATINKNILACNSSATTFQYTFPLIDTANATDLQVSQFDNLGNQTVLTTNYSVNTTTGTVTYPVSGTACPTGYTIVLLRVEPLTQGVAASYQGPGPTPPVMQMSDKLTMISQQLNEALNRALLLPLTLSSGTTFPGVQAGAFIGWNSSGVLSNLVNPGLVAQWTANGANISYNTGNVSTSNTLTAGNIGVGSTAPGSTFDVQGTARFLTGNVGIGTDATPDATLEVTTLSGTAPFRVSSTSTTSGDYLSVINGGNVGVGSITPGQLLDVQGTVRAKSFVGLNGLNFNANVGIGSASPGAALDVQGTIRATGFAGAGTMFLVQNGTSSTASSITISNLTVGIHYKLFVNFQQTTSAGYLKISINGDNAGNYNWVNNNGDTNGDAGIGGAAGVDFYVLAASTSTYPAASTPFSGEVDFLPAPVNMNSAIIRSHIVFNNGTYWYTSVGGGYYAGSAGITSIILTPSAGTLTGAWSLYEVN